MRSHSGWDCLPCNLGCNDYRSTQGFFQSLSPEKAAQAAEQVHAFWSATWLEALIPAMERLPAMSFHVSAAVLVLQVFDRENLLFLWLAIVFHTAIDTLAVIASSNRRCCTDTGWGPARQSSMEQLQKTTKVARVRFRGKLQPTLALVGNSYNFVKL